MPSKRITCMRRGRLYMYSKRHRLNAGSTARVTYTRKAINGRSIRAAVRVRQKFTNLLVICRRRAQDSAHGSSASTCRSRRLSDCCYWRWLKLQNLLTGRKRLCKSWWLWNKMPHTTHDGHHHFGLSFWIVVYKKITCSSRTQRDNDCENLPRVRIVGVLENTCQPRNYL